MVLNFKESAVVAFSVDDILFFSNKKKLGIGVVFWFVKHASLWNWKQITRQTIVPSSLTGDLS